MRACWRSRDSGPGVPADALPRLFEPFFSLKTTGTGLGLAIVKRTVEAHGGRVEARTAAGGGLLLRVELPPPRPAQRARPERRGGASGAMRPSILVVDDERTIGIAIERLLSGARLRRRPRCSRARRRSSSSRRAPAHLVITDLEPRRDERHGPAALGAASTRRRRRSS